MQQVEARDPGVATIPKKKKKTGGKISGYFSGTVLRHTSYIEKRVGVGSLSLTYTKMACLGYIISLISYRSYLRQGKLEQAKPELNLKHT